MIYISIKHDFVLSHIEALEAGAKVSVRGLATELNVSEGTVYKAIKEAEIRGLVITKPKSGTVRVETDSSFDERAVTISEIVATLGVGCIAGKKNMGCTIDKVIICDSDESQLINQLEECNPPHTLCVVGNRPDFQTIVAQYKAHMLITGGNRPTDYHIVKAEKNGVCILTSIQNTYTILRLFDSQMANQLPSADESIVSDWMQTPNYLYRNDIVADWQRFYHDNLSGLKSYPVVDDDLHLCGGIDITRTFAASHSQKLSTLISDDARILSVDASSSVREVAQKMILSGSSYAAVIRDNKMEGVIYTSDLLRYFMFAGSEDIPDFDSLLSYIPDFSTEDRRVYELHIPDTELSNLSTLGTALVLSAAGRHLAQIGSINYKLISSSFLYPAEITDTGDLMLCTTLTSSAGSGFSIDAEIYNEANTFSKAMLIFSENK